MHAVESLPDTGRRLVTIKQPTVSDSIPLLFPFKANGQRQMKSLVKSLAFYDVTLGNTTAGSFAQKVPATYKLLPLHR